MRTSIERSLTHTHARTAMIHIYMCARGYMCIFGRRDGDESLSVIANSICAAIFASVSMMHAIGRKCYRRDSPPSRATGGVLRISPRMPEKEKGENVERLALVHFIIGSIQAFDSDRLAYQSGMLRIERYYFINIHRLSSVHIRAVLSLGQKG